MNQILRDQRSSLIDAIGVELKIAKVTLPGSRDNLNVAKVSAFTDAVKRIRMYAEQLAQAAGLPKATEDPELLQPDMFPDTPLTLDLDPGTLTVGRVVPITPNSAESLEQEVDDND